jgi:hypothetical protein
VPHYLSRQNVLPATLPQLWRNPSYNHEQYRKHLSLHPLLPGRLHNFCRWVLNDPSNHLLGRSHVRSLCSYRALLSYVLVPFLEGSSPLSRSSCKQTGQHHTRCHIRYIHVTEYFLVTCKADFTSQSLSVLRFAIKMSRVSLWRVPYRCSWQPPKALLTNETRYWFQFVNRTIHLIHSNINIYKLLSLGTI